MEKERKKFSSCIHVIIEPLTGSAHVPRPNLFKLVIAGKMGLMSSNSPISQSTDLGGLTFDSYKL
jgi:hypothetical protein